MPPLVMVPLACAKTDTSSAHHSLTKTIDAEVEGEMAVLKEAINDMVYKLRLFSSEVTRVSLDVGTRGQLGGQAVVTGVEGTWRTRAPPCLFRYPFPPARWQAHED